MISIKNLRPKLNLANTINKMGQLNKTLIACTKIKNLVKHETVKRDIEFLKRLNEMLEEIQDFTQLQINKRIKNGIPNDDGKGNAPKSFDRTATRRFRNIKDKSKEYKA